MLLSLNGDSKYEIKKKSEIQTSNFNCPFQCELDPSGSFDDESHLIDSQTLISVKPDDITVVAAIIQ